MHWAMGKPQFQTGLYSLEIFCQLMKSVQFIGNCNIVESHVIRDTKGTGYGQPI